MCIFEQLSSSTQTLSMAPSVYAPCGNGIFSKTFFKLIKSQAILIIFSFKLGLTKQALDKTNTQTLLVIVNDYNSKGLEIVTFGGRELSFVEVMNSELVVINQEN